MNFQVSTEPQIHVLPSWHFDGRKPCKCCGSRPVAGYVGSGTVINDLCVKCYRANAETRERRAEKHQTAARKGRS